MNDIIQCIAAFLGCIGLSFIFRSHQHFHFSLLGSLVGTIGWIIYLLLRPIHNIYIQNFVAMLCVALISEMLARRYKAPATFFIIIGCFPLVPGKGIYYTMLYAVQGMNDLFMETFLTTFGVSISLALAILISSSTLQVYKRIINKDFVDIN